MLKRLRHYRDTLQHVRLIHLTADKHADHLHNCDLCWHAIFQANPHAGMCLKGTNLFNDLRNAISNAKHHQDSTP